MTTTPLAQTLADAANALLGAGKTGTPDWSALASSPLGTLVLSSAALKAARIHPLASAAAGAGVLWLALGRPGLAQVDAAIDHAAPNENWKKAADAALDKARKRLDDLVDDGTTKAAKEQAAVAKDFAKDLAKAFAEGLDGLEDDVAAAAVAAREKAYGAIDGLKAAAGKAKAGCQHTQDTSHHAALATAAVLAIGAVVAGTLCVARTSNETVGQTADRLLKEGWARMEAGATKAAHAAQDVAAAATAQGANLLDKTSEGAKTATASATASATATAAALAEATEAAAGRIAERLRAAS